MAEALPTLFIGSSTEALRIARAAAGQFDGVAQVTLWTDPDAFRKPNEYFLDSLVAAAERFDFALLVFGMDDTVTIRDKVQHITRDNVVFELGLFWSRLGRERTFVLAPEARRNTYRILSDLEGLTFATYTKPRQPGNAAACVKPACDKIGNSIGLLGQRAATTAPRSVVDIGKPLEQLMRAARQKKAPIVIKNIGLDMESTWPLLHEKILAVDAVESVTWHSLMVDAESPVFDGMWSHTVSRETARYSEAKIAAFCAEHGDRLGRRKVDFACRSYASLPSVHGFLFNDTTAFLSLCGVRDGKLFGAPNPYLQIDRPSSGPSDPASAHLIMAFESWFDHHWRHGARPIWPC